MRSLRILALILGACSYTLGTVSATQAAVHRRAKVKHAKTLKHTKIHGLAGPGLLTPADGAHVQQIPTLSWNAVSGAAEYEYQIAADHRFDSIVLGTGTGMGTATTYNLA